MTRRRCLAMATAGCLAPSMGYAQQPTAGRVEAPFDHRRPSEGTLPLRYEWGGARRSGNPVVLVVADGQQFYTRPGAAARLQAELFGPDVDVLVPFGRGREPALAGRLIAPAGVNWPLAHQLLNRDQWLSDLRLLIETLKLRETRLYLYGRSGGAYLIYEWMQTDNRAADRVYVQAAVNPELDVRWGLGADRIWEEMTARDPDVAAAILDHIRERPERRAALVQLLQRQNFFEPLEAIEAARAKLMRAFLDGDETVLAQLRRTYQIDALQALQGTIEGVASTVRLFEFAASRRDPRTRADRLSPDVELLFNRAEPLLALQRAGRITSPARDWSRLSEQRAEVLQLAGRYDHTADYRVQIGLEAAVARGRLLLLNDDHTFKRLADTGRHSALLQTFFAHGASSTVFEQHVVSLQPLLWNEGGARASIDHSRTLGAFVPERA